MDGEGTGAAPGEAGRLKSELRDRQSIVRLARAWSAAFCFLLLSGLWAKLFVDSVGVPLFLWPGALLCLSVLMFSIREVWQGRRLLAVDRERLRRLRELEAKGAGTQELF